jgi:c-di-GMP-binding flagellar brake protein YcgR
MENKIKPQERRRAHRVYASFIEYCRVENEDSKKIQAFVENVSASGICILVNEEIEPGCFLSITIYLLDESAPIETKAKVAWIRPSTFLNLKDSKHYDAGIVFVEMAKENKDRLSSYTVKYANEKPPSEK